jgi:two-component system, LytTR family, response regulator
MEKQLTCIIVDDEPLAQELLEKHIRKMPVLRLLEKCSNAIDAMDRIRFHKPDILFLDVNMPEMTGVELLKTFAQVKPNVILTTAYPEYAIYGYEYDVVDYLLKPIPFDRFMKAVNKVADKLMGVAPAAAPGSPFAAPPTTEEEPVFQKPGDKSLLIKQNKKFINVNPEDIYFVEGMKDYIKLHLADTALVTHMTMTKIEEMLPRGMFLKVNRSFIVRKTAIKNIEGNTIRTKNGKEIPIGISFRDTIREYLKGGAL